MSEPIVQHNSNTPTTEQDVLQDNKSPISFNFESSFHPFPLQFDEYIFKHWYIFIIIFSLIYLILAVLYDVRAAVFFPAQDFYNLKNTLTFWPLISMGITLILTALFFNRWRRSIRPTFQKLLSSGRIHSTHQDGDINQEYRHFLKGYQDALLSNKRYILIGVSIVIFVVLLVIPTHIPPRYVFDPFLMTLRWLILIFENILLSLILGYGLGVGAWAIGITGLYIRKLTSEFALTIQPSHPDHCGGLKSLGNFCLDMALPILISAIFLGVYGIGSTFYPTLIYGQSILQIDAIVVLIVFVLPLAAIAFFVPLLGIHREMIIRKETFEDEFADHIMKLEKQIQSSLDKGALKMAKVAKEEMEVLQVLHPDKIGYPTWPFDRRILLTFLTPQIVPILSLIISLIVPLIKHT